MSILGWIITWSVQWMKRGFLEFPDPWIFFLTFYAWFVPLESLFLFPWVFRYFGSIYFPICCVPLVLIYFLQPFRHFTYVTTHSPTLPPLHLRHSSFSNPSFASPTSQALHLIYLASRPWKEPLWRASIPGIYRIPKRTHSASKSHNYTLHSDYANAHFRIIKFSLCPSPWCGR